MTNLHNVDNQHDFPDLVAVAKLKGGPSSRFAKIFGFKDKPYRLAITSDQKKADKLIGSKRTILAIAPIFEAGKIKTSVGMVERDEIKETTGLYYGAITSLTGHAKIIPAIVDPRIVDIFVVTHNKMINVIKSTETYLGSVSVNSPLFNQTLAIFNDLGVPVTSDFKLMNNRKFAPKSTAGVRNG